MSLLFCRKFKNYPLSIIDYSGIRGEEDYFDNYFSFYFLKRYIGTVDYIHKNPIKSIKTRIVCNLLQVICLFKNFRKQLKISNSITNDNYLKIYYFSRNFNTNFCKKIIYFHYPRHKEYIKYIQPSKNKAILFSSHILSEVEAICNRVYILNFGKIIYSANIKKLTDNSLNSFQFEFSNKFDESIILEKFHKSKINRIN